VLLKALKWLPRLLFSRRTLLALGLTLLVAGASLVGLGVYNLIGDSGDTGNPFEFLKDTEIVLRQEAQHTQASPFRDLNYPSGAPNLPITNYYFQPPAGQPLDLFPQEAVVADMEMVIDSVDVRAPVIAMGLDANAVPQVPLTGYQVAWYDFSGKPGGGSNAVFSGHVTWGRKPAIFWSLKDLKVGDDIELITAGGKYVYEVFANFRVDPDDPNALKVMAPTEGDIITLITCGGRWLPNPSERFGGDYSERVIVQARLVSFSVANISGG